MIKFEKTEVMGWQQAIRGMRNPMNSWEKSDSGICKGGDDGIGCENCAAYDCEHTYDHSFQLGKNDMGLMRRLRNAGTDHRKFMRMITVYVDITAPFYWWKEFDTYKVGTVANSCSTMHKIGEKEFTMEDFSHEHLSKVSLLYLEGLIEHLNFCRDIFNADKTNKGSWWQMIQLLPSSYNQKRTVLLNYEVLANIYKSRKGHKLDEWHLHEPEWEFDVAEPWQFGFCDWIESLPYSELITGNFKGDV
ncbi:MAG: hypothetical protein KH921_07140 [Erysipelotrichaceae bacterium]|nr:hypothetical protein [Erysipelotrichaceae bacterium]